MDSTAQTVSATDGRTLVVAQWGDQHGPPVFELHGIPGCRLIRTDVAAVTAELGVRLVTYDRPGYGGSDRRRGRRIVDCAEDVAAVADALRIDSFAVLGGSGGGPHALAVAALLGPRITRAACVASPAPYDALGEEWWRDADPEVARIVDCILQGEERYAALVSHQDQEMRREADGATREIVAEQTRNGIRGWVDDDLALLAPWGFDPAGIDVPTAVWYNPDDDVIRPRHAEWLAATIPRAGLSRTTTLGHVRSDDRVPEYRRLYGWLRGDV